MLGAIAISSIPIFCLGVIAYYSIKEALRPKVEIIENLDFIKNMSQIKFYKSKDNDTNDIGVDFTYNLPVSLSNIKKMIDDENKYYDKPLSPCEGQFFNAIKSRKDYLKKAIKDFEQFCKNNSSVKKYPICLKFPDRLTNDLKEIFYYIRFNENEDSGYIFTTTQIKYSVSEEGKISISESYKEVEKKQEDRTTVKEKIPQKYLRNRNIYNDEGKEIDNSKLFLEDVNCFAEIIDLKYKKNVDLVEPDGNMKNILILCFGKEGKDLYNALKNYQNIKSENSNTTSQAELEEFKEKIEEQSSKNSCSLFSCCSGITKEETINL